MLRELAVNTRVIYYLMALLGMIGVLAKAVNQQTLNQMLKAAGNMSKSTHRLIKLVRAKYEHACMVHDSVENTNAFVEKYIYEYRGFLFGIHTWRQMQLRCGLLEFLQLLVHSNVILLMDFQMRRINI